MIDILLLDAAVLGAIVLALWLLSLAIRDSSIVDIFWGPGFAILAVATLLQLEQRPARTLLLAGLCATWGLRLGGYLFLRNHGKGEDFRYAAWRKQYGDRWWIRSLFQVFVLQGALMFVVSLPVVVGMIRGGDPPGLGPWEAVGAAVWAVGVVFEAVGDAQLARFKADPSNAGKVMDRGLWRYTRHPNYFGDFAMWWGLWCVAAAAPGARWTVIGPLIMSWLLLKVSGVVMLEKTIGKRRPGYADYARRTSTFFPRPPKA